MDFCDCAIHFSEDFLASFRFSEGFCDDDHDCLSSFSYFFHLFEEFFGHSIHFSEDFCGDDDRFFVDFFEDSFHHFYDDVFCHFEDFLVQVNLHSD